ncbi:uncharacterized protein LOC111948027 [Oryzias latipes]|uniref:uncharacterized protein LOC111948027 n=1 Tax=Oryzias latipes TaxID=8090 RepID=UPI000CE19178|nr:uncharacterized protein LOC111948027 [Oryzias latipes]
MLPRKTVSFPSFRSPLNSRQRNEPQLDRTEQPCRPQSEKSEDKRAKSRRKKANPSALKVKLAKVSPNSPAIPKTSRRRLTLEPTTPKTNINQGSGTSPALVDRDVFLFSPASQTKTTNEKDKARLSVLRTISRMLEENLLIRRRLEVLSQAR